MTRRDLFCLAIPLAAIELLFLIGPAVFGFIGSFTDYAPTRLHTHFIGLDNYAAVVQSSEFGRAVENVIIYGPLSVIAELALGFLLAYGLREPFRGREWLRVLLLIPWLISPVANGVLWHFLFSSERGLFSSLFAWFGSPGMPSPLGIPGLALPATMLSDIWRKTPFVSFLVLPGILAIPSGQWEDAMLQGASTMTRIRHIALPGLRPLLLALALLLLGDALGAFDNILVMTGGGPGSRTLMPGLYSYQAAFGHDNWPVGATSAWLIVAAVLLCGVAYVKFARQDSTLAWPRWPGGFGILPRVQLPSLAFLQFGWRSQKRLRAWTRALLLSLFIVALALPLLWTALASLNIEPETGVSPPRWQVAPSFENYREIGATEPGFVQELLTSTTLALATTLLTTTLAFLAAYAVSHLPARGMILLLQILLILASLPVMAYAIPLSGVVRAVHLYDTFLGVTLAETAVLSPLAVYVLIGYLAQLSPEFEESAYLDGATPLQAVKFVVLPMIFPGVTATAVVVFVLSWNQFLLPLVLSTGEVRSIPMAMADVFKWDRELEWSAVAAAVVASVLPLLILITAAHRWLVRFRLMPSGD